MPMYYSINDTIVVVERIIPTRKSIKAKKKQAKIEAKKDIIIEKEKTKQVRSDNKGKKGITKVEERNKTKRNVVFQLFSSIKVFLRGLTIGQILGGGSGVAGLMATLMGMGEKLKPMEWIQSLLSKKEE